MNDDKNNMQTAETVEGYERLKRLMDGKSETQPIYDPSRSMYYNMQRMKLLCAVVVLIVCMVMIFAHNIANPPMRPAYSRTFNPVSKIILYVKANDYMEENYPDFEKNMEIDMTNGMLKYKNGYMVTCRDTHNRTSTVAVYFDKNFEITHDSPRIRKSE